MRRWILLAVVLAVATAAACSSSSSSSSSAASTTVANTPADPDPIPEIETVGGTLCEQPYALCNNAECVEDPEDPDVAICTCIREEGWSIGNTSCEDRAPLGNRLVSTFSTANAADLGVMTCPAGLPWANCYDAECEEDPDTGVIECACPITSSDSEWITFGGGCDKDTCSTTLWSAAPASSDPNSAVPSYVNALTDADIPFNPVVDCEDC